jgi:23S rRNA (uridine2552-2'-O)-methyltransferase
VGRTKKSDAKSAAWMRGHVNDPFVKRAQADGYRSRAAYKLLEITRQDRLFRPGMVVADLGAAPGSWSQVAAKAVLPAGRVVAVDLLDMKPLPGVHFLHADMTSEQAGRELAAALGGPADLVLCDMAPNLSGVASTDEARHQDLCELALGFSREHLKPGGTLLIKAFQGVGYREFMQMMKQSFATVVSRKPAASRDRSAEMYLLGKGFRPS